MKERRVFPFYPLLLGLVPFLSLLALNFTQVQLQDTLRAAGLSLLLSLGVFLLAWLALRRVEKAALAAGIFLLFFLTYGYFYDALQTTPFGRHRFLAPLWGVLLAAALVGVVRSRADLRNLSLILNIVSGFWTVYLLLHLGWGGWQYYQSNRSNQVGSNDVLKSAQAEPDVYYIILDSYDRADVLQKLYKFDNQPFVDALTQMGMVFPSCTMSNYGITTLSLASSLNMDYVEQVRPDLVAANRNWSYFGDALVHSRVRSNFENLGYQSVGLETGIWWDEMTDADLYMSRTGDASIGKINAFEWMYLRTTGALPLFEGSSLLFARANSKVVTPDEDQYRRVAYVFEQLQRLPTVRSPKFVFVHILAPHEPFVYGPNGEFVPSSSNPDGYLNAVRYLNQQVVETVRVILEKSSTPPIIIVQGDHGNQSEDHMSILNAYYLPGSAKDQLYATITPVNTFRLIFNAYFGGAYPLLPDKSFLSDHRTPYSFELIPNTCLDK